MRAIQERHGNNTPKVSYTRGTDLSGSLEGAGLPRQSQATAGGIGGLLARSAGYSPCDSSLTVTITNGSTVNCIFWIYSDAGTNVDGAVVWAGTASDFTFSAVAGVQYTIYGTDTIYHGLGILDVFTAALDHRQMVLASDDPDPEEFSVSESGSLLCNGPGAWPYQDYYFADGNGNITTLLDASQNVSASYRYDPFGNTISQSGSLADANVYRFSSKEIHVNSGMYYYGYRFYDPYLQRWINRDPIAEEGGLNHYTFVKNDPTDFADPEGLSILGDFLS